MKCPNCGKEMVDKSYSKFEEFYHWEDEQFYYKRNYYEKFVCNDCKISFVNDEWDIPGELQATEAQIKACNFVSRELGYEPPPPTKRAMWKFLHETLDEAKDRREKRWIDSWDGYDYPIPEEDCY